MEDWQLELFCKSANLDSISFYLKSNPEKIFLLVNGLSSQDDTFRYNNFLLSEQLCQEDASLLYPYWQQIEAMLPSENNYHRSIAVRLLAALCPADVDNRFESIMTEYFSCLRGGSIMTARYIVQSCSLIFVNKPDLRSRIVDTLLCIEDYCDLPPERVDLIRVDILDFLDAVFALLNETDSALDFAKAALSAHSPKTRQAAKLFLKKHSINPG